MSFLWHFRLLCPSGSQMISLEYWVLGSSVDPFQSGNDSVHQSRVHGLLTTTSNEENIYSRFSSNSEAVVSELLENLEKIFPRYW